MQDLRSHRHILIRESSVKRTGKPLIDTTQRWTVSSAATSIEAVRTGYGFAWFPEDDIREELRAGTLKPLPIRGGSERYAELYLVLADPDSAGPGVLRLTQMIRDTVKSTCRQYQESVEEENAE
jgi:DNA-binding transcriptional LysR family regulator